MDEEVFVISGIIVTTEVTYYHISKFINLPSPSMGAVSFPGCPFTYPYIVHPNMAPKKRVNIMAQSTSVHLLFSSVGPFSNDLSAL